MEVRVLGPLEVLLDGVPVPVGARMERALLTILVLESGRVVPADRLADLLWDGEPPPKAAAALHTKIAHLRRALQPERAPRADGSLIVTAAPGYRLSREQLVVDADRFESLLAEAGKAAGRDPARAVDLVDTALASWRGPALGEFAEETFARAAAQRLETLRLAAVELRASATLALGDTAGAVAALQPHVAAHPLREQARAELARALYVAGRQAEALAVLAEGRRVLREELGLDPGPDLRRLEQQVLDQDEGLRRGSRPAATARPAPPPAVVALHGREPECTLLARAVEDATAGSGCVVLVTGDAGMGKSALLEVLRGAVVRAGGLDRSATCREGLAAPPFWPVLQMVRTAAPTLDPAGRSRLARALGPLRAAVPDLADLSAGDPAPGGVDPAMVLVHASDALDAVLGSAPHGGVGPPAVVAFDDLHAADPATLQLVGGLATEVHRTRTVLAIALRSGEGLGQPALVDVLATLGRLPRVVRLDLGPLPEPAITDLVRAELSDAGQPAALEQIVARAEGNPFFALELARVSAQAGPAGAEGVPAAVHDVLRQRYGRLPEGGTDLLAAAAVAGAPVSVDDVAAVTELSAYRVLALVDAAVSARLLVDVGDGRVAMSHALLADAVLAAQASARRVRLHRAFADRLAARHGSGPDESSRIAAHYRAARVLDGGAAALDWSERAADHALAVSALDQLREIGQQTLALLAGAPVDPDPAGTRRRELRARSRIAFADAWAGGMDSPSIREYCRLVRTWEVPRPAEPADMDLLWLATLFSGQLGRLDDADVIVARMAALDGELEDPTAGYLCHDITAVVRWMQGRFDEALVHLDRAEQAVAAGVDLRRSLALSPATRLALVRAHCLWQLGRTAEAWEQAEAGLTAADAAGSGAAGFAHRWVLVLAMMDGEVRRVRRLLDRPPSDPAWDRFRYPSAVVRFARGWVEARTARPGSRAARAGLAVMREAHAELAGQGLAGGRSILLGLMAEEALRHGEVEEAIALSAAGLAIGERGERYWTAALQRVAATARTTARIEARTEARISGRQEPDQSVDR
jgi:DNA-binding SARP family transcriptional activator/energy-coupling factor transporter ATP-binding protein EcfA2